jgi:glutathione synthase/RimK-type ligase-like ATP-grasp enzyme
VELREPTAAERALAQKRHRPLRRGRRALCFAGVDLLYDGGAPVVSEVEDVVGSRDAVQNRRAGRRRALPGRDRRAQHRRPSRL